MNWTPPHPKALSKACQVLVVMLSLAAVAPVTAQPGNALEFDGNDVYVSTSCSINFSQSSGNSYTFSAWVKLDATDGSTGQIVCSDDGPFDWSILKAKKKNE